MSRPGSTVTGVLTTRRPKYACHTCTDGVVQAPAPAWLIQAGLPTEATIAHVLVSKYAEPSSALAAGPDHEPPGHRSRPINAGRLGRSGSGGAPPDVAFTYAPGRGGIHAERILKGFSGILQVDGYAGYNRLIAPERIGPDIRLAYCWAHARASWWRLSIGAEY